MEKVTPGTCSTSATSSRSRPRLVRDAPAVGELPSATASASCCSTSTRTPRSRSSSCCPGCSAVAHPVTAVGDPCQAIYGWRGASVANIDGFPDRLPASGRQPVEPLLAVASNNRSGGLLLDLANALSAPLRERHPGVGDAGAPAGRSRCRRGSSARCTRPTRTRWRRRATGSASLVATGYEPARHRGPRARAQRLRRRTTTRWCPAACRSRSSVSAVCCRCRRWPTSSRCWRCSTTPTANPALVRLLTGPRWRIGPRDLALLGRRAAELVRVDTYDVGTHGVDTHDADADDGDDIERLLEAAVAGVDPVDVVSLLEALDHPGGRPYSAAARAKFGRLSAELRALRRHLGEPLLDLLRRVLSTTGLEVEVGAAPRPHAPVGLTRSARSSTTRPRSPTSRATRACARSSPT